MKMYNGIFGVTLTKTLIGLLLLPISLLSPAAAQSCGGILGPALVNQTFGTGPGQPLSASQTTYRAITSGCPQDGEYMLSGSTTCFSDNWHSLYEDHTPGDQHGNMLIVNASEEAGEFYTQAVDGLCAGTTYEFSAYVLNLMMPGNTGGCTDKTTVSLDPNITMRVETDNGTALQTIYTGTIPRTANPTWVRYATLVAIPANTHSIVIKLINNGPGGCGNDLALDDIQLRPCRPQLQIRFENETTDNLALCENSRVNLRSALPPPGSNPAYQWQESRDSLSWHPVSGAAGPQYDLQNSGPGKTYYRLLASPTAASPGTWDAACSSVSNTLTLTALGPGECHEWQVYVPTAFSPNNDGLNDHLQIYADGALDQFDLTILNRWGTVVFTSETLTHQWDGTYANRPCAEAAYAWIIHYQRLKQSRLTRFTKTGQVFLIR